MANASPAPPPYMSFGVFKSTIETLAQSTVPTGPLDRRVLDGLSGADYGSLISGLRFLGFVDDDRRATDRYRDLVQAYKKGPQVFSGVMLDLISPRYDSIIGNVDTEHGTISELERAFRDAGVSPGQMLTKSIRFYVKFLQEIGVPVSPHITKARKSISPRANGAQPKKKQPKADPASSRDAVDVGERKTPEGSERLPIPGLSGAFIQYPANLTEANCDLFEAMIGVLRTYVKGRSGGKEKKA
jgi:hypothetical protein